MPSPQPTLEQLHEELQDLRVQFTNLETRIMAVERDVTADRKQTQEESRKMYEALQRVENKVSGVESLTDANFLAITHMLGVIARKLKVPAKDLKTGDRHGKAR